MDKISEEILEDICTRFIEISQNIREEVEISRKNELDEDNHIENIIGSLGRMLQLEFGKTFLIVARKLRERIMKSDVPIIPESSVRNNSNGSSPFKK